MSDNCPFCGSSNVVSGYGYAAGPLGGYEICNSCTQTVTWVPDLEGLDKEEYDKLVVLSNQFEEKKEAKLSDLYKLKKIDNVNQLIIGQTYWTKRINSNWPAELKLIESVLALTGEEHKFFKVGDMRMWCWRDNDQVSNDYDIYGPITMPTFEQCLKLLGDNNEKMGNV